MTTSIGRGEDERGHGGTHEEGERSPRQEEEETKRKSCMCGPARTCGTLALVGVCVAPLLRKRLAVAPVLGISVALRGALLIQRYS